MSRLRAVIEAAARIAPNGQPNLGALTVLKHSDPYRFNTPANHTLGHWFAEILGRLVPTLFWFALALLLLTHA
jgi:hypothetical protein